MGTTIAYKGRLNQPDLVYPISKELIEIALEMNWEYWIIDEDYSKPITAYLDRENSELSIKGHLAVKGISLGIHPDAGSLSFYFDKQGNLKNIVSILISGEEDGEPTFEYIKTNDAPADVHIAVVTLLRYIKTKYMSDLYVEDESGFWETANETSLYSKVHLLRQKLHELKDLLENVDILKENRNSPLCMTEKIENIIIKKSEKIYTSDGIEKSA